VLEVISVIFLCLENGGLLNVMKKNSVSLMLFVLHLVFANVAYSAVPDKEFLKLCESSTRETINAAIQDGANVYAKNNLQQTTLILAAAWNQDPSVVSLLLDAGVDINAKDFHGATALMRSLIGSKDGFVDHITIAGFHPELANVLQSLRVLKERPYLLSMSKLALSIVDRAMKTN
jgi:hypothetical protein